MQKHRNGFTLFESIVVLAVMVVAAAIAMPSLRSLSGATPLNAAADTVKARWAEARNRAIAEGRPYRFAVMHNTGKLRVAPDSSEFWDGSTSGSASSQGDGSQPPLVVEDTLPQNMKFVSAPDESGGASQGQQGGSGGEWDCPVVFLPDGTTQQDAQIAFGSQGGKPLVLRVQSATGAATMSR